MFSSSSRISLLLALSAALSGCGNKASEGLETPAFSSDTGSTSPSTSSSTVTSTLTSTVTETSLRTITELSVLTATATVTVTQASTVTATVSATATQTQTQTQTATVTKTGTVTATVSAVQTVTATQTSTVTATVTAIELGWLPTGKFESEDCVLNRLASEAYGRNVYAESVLYLWTLGTGENDFDLYEDSSCRRKIDGDKAKITYGISKPLPQLYLFAVEQEGLRYWIPAQLKENGWLLDVDYAKGAKAPFLSAPGEAELKDALDHIAHRGVLFRKK
jgi:hypothetical protein